MDDAMQVIRDLVYEDEDGTERSVLDLLAEALQTTSDEVKAYGTAGAVTLKLTVSPEKKHSKVTQSIVPALSRSAPKRKLTGIIRFNRDGRLSRSDSRQAQMDLKVVPNGQGEERDVAVGDVPARRV